MLRGPVPVAMLLNGALLFPKHSSVVLLENSDQTLVGWLVQGKGK